MRSPLCDWEEVTIFLAECVEAEELGLNYAGLALEAALLACLGVAVAYAWRHCRVGRGEARTRRRRTLVGKARLDGGRAGSDIPSAAAQSAATARSIVCHIVQAASCTSTQTDLSIAPDQLIRWLSPAGSWMDHGTPACTGQVPSVTPPPHARRVSQRPAAEKTSAKPSDDQRLFTQRAVSLAPEPSPPSCTTQEPRPRRAQRRSPPGPDQTPTPAATTTSNSAPNVKLSSGALSLAEMVRRHRAMQETSPETPVRTPVCVAAKERMERGNTGLYRGLRGPGRSGRGSGAAAPRHAGQRPQCSHSHKPWSGADLAHESDEKHERERNQERPSAATRCRRRQPGAQDRDVVAGYGNRFELPWKTGVEFPEQ